MVDTLHSMPPAPIPPPEGEGWAPIEPTNARQGVSDRFPFGKLGIAIGATAASVLAVVSGANILGHDTANSTDPAPKPELTKQPSTHRVATNPAHNQPRSATTILENTSQDNLSETQQSEGTTKVGTLDLKLIKNGEPFITATRPNGEQIQVPYLGGETPNEIASSALALLACYLTTGSQECLSAFSTNEEVQNSLVDWRAKDILPMLQDTQNTDSQVAIFDDPDDPAIFSSHYDESGREVIRLESGKVYFGRVLNNFGSNEWQHSDIKRFKLLENTIYDIAFFIRETANGGKTVVRLEPNIAPTQS